MNCEKKNESSTAKHARQNEKAATKKPDRRKLDALAQKRKSERIPEV